MLDNLYGKTSDILGVPTDFVQEYSHFVLKDILETATPEILAEKILDNFGDGLNEAVSQFYDELFEAD